MSKLEKLLLRVKENPKAVRFAELDKILFRAGFARSQPASGSSHYIYRKDGLKLVVPLRVVRWTRGNRLGGDGIDETW